MDMYLYAKKKENMQKHPEMIWVSKNCVFQPKYKKEGQNFLFQCTFLKNILFVKLLDILHRCQYCISLAFRFESRYLNEKPRGN